MGKPYRRWYDHRTEVQESLKWVREELAEIEAIRAEKVAQIAKIEERLTQPFEPGRFIEDVHLSSAEIMDIFDDVVKKTPDPFTSDVFAKLMK